MTDPPEIPEESASYWKLYERVTRCSVRQWTRLADDIERSRP